MGDTTVLCRPSAQKKFNKLALNLIRWWISAPRTSPGLAKGLAFGMMFWKVRESPGAKRHGGGGDNMESVKIKNSAAGSFFNASQA